jgi:hypothetical protein
MIVTVDSAGNQGMPDTSRRQEGGSRVDEVKDIGREV